MSREKQIEEMAKHCHFYEKGKCLLLEEDAVECDMNCDMCKFAKTLYNAGYRRTADVAEEIFAEIEKILKKNEFRNYEPYNVESYYSGDLKNDLAELKKKYESEKDNG